MKKYAVLVAYGVLLSIGTAGAAPQQVDFVKQIQPIFKKSCLKCHGPDKAKGHLRLDRKEIAFKKAIVPGHPEKSELYKRIILPPDDDDVMPSKGPHLTKDQTDLIKNWIAQGAPWPDTVQPAQNAPPKNAKLASSKTVAAATSAPKVDFATQIQPIFENSCLKCHGPNKQKGHLRLDQKASALKKDIVPGHPEKSELFRRIALPVGDDDVMPSKGDHLTKEQVELVRLWILQGASWPERLAELGGKVDFATQIQPLFQNHCYQCHGPKKQKGHLRLDQKEVALKKAIVPGHAERSELIRRISLPKTDDDHMPAKGSPLTAEQIALIQHWINQGAEWPEVAAVRKIEFSRDIRPILKRLTPEQVKTLKLWVEQGAHWPAEKAASVHLVEIPVSDSERAAAAKLQQAGVLVLPVAQKVNWLVANFKSLGKTVTDATVKPLARMPNLLEVDLGNTGITDAGLVCLENHPNLTRVHLENTAVGDAGVGHLAGCTNLVYLNLYGTKVTDNGLKALEGLKTLQKVYVWQTKVTDAGVQALEQALPGVEVVQGWNLVASNDRDAAKKSETGGEKTKK